MVELRSEMDQPVTKSREMPGQGGCSTESGQELLELLLCGLTGQAATYSETSFRMISHLKRSPTGNIVL